MVGDQSPLQLLGFPIGGHRFVVTSLGFEEIPQLLEARAEPLAEQRTIGMGRPERTQNVDGRAEMFFRLRSVVRVGFDDGQRESHGGQFLLALGVVWGVMQKFGPDLVGARQKLLGQGARLRDALSMAAFTSTVA